MRSRPHPGREAIPDHLEKREVVIPVPKEECHCAACGLERPVIGYETRETVECQPAVYFCQVTKREKRGACPCHQEEGVVLARAPQRILPKSKLGDEFLLEVLARKFQSHAPVYRQVAVLAEEFNLEISRQTINQALLQIGQLLQPVAQAIGAELKQGSYLQVDETPVPVQVDKPKGGKNHQAYLWQYSLPHGPVYFEFQMSRGREGPQNFLRGFQGMVQSDGFSAYDKLGEGIIYAGCVAHGRRKFVQARKVAQQDPAPLEIVKIFGELYAIEREASLGRLGPEERKKLRQEKSVPVMERLQKRLLEVRAQVMPGSVLAKACDYSLGQWERYQVFLEHGEVEIDNNWCEGGMRPIALGRKNWLHIGSKEAGPWIAAMASIVETCRRLDIKLKEYLRGILPGLGDWPMQRVGELTPMAWKKRQAT